MLNFCQVGKVTLFGNCDKILKIASPQMIFCNVIQNCFTKRRKSITESIETETDPDNAILYGLDDVPPWYLSIFMALQVSAVHNFRLKIHRIKTDNQVLSLLMT